MKYARLIHALNKKEIYLLTILILSSLFLLTPIPSARLQDDEVIYYIITKDFIDDFKFPAHKVTTIVPFLLWAPAIILKDSILSMRVVTALITILTAILIYFIAKRLFSAHSLIAFTSSLLYIFSFHILRFGIRVALDPISAFFAILSLHFLLNRKPSYSGASFSLAALSYQFWIPMYPIYLIQAHRQRVSLRRFIITSFIVGLFFLAISLAQYDFNIFTEREGDGFASAMVSMGNWPIFMDILQGWLEFSIISVLLILGLVLGFWTNPAKWVVSFIILQSMIISLSQGFAIYGGASHYTYGLCPLLALVAGYGFFKTFRFLNRRKRINLKAYPIFLLAILFAQLILFNHLATNLSTHGVEGIYDVGYKYDVEAIETIKEMDRGGFIVGQTTHGMLVDKSRFDWGDFPDNIFYFNPQIIMAYKTDISIKNDSKASQSIRSAEVGPYLIISSQNDQNLSDFIELSTSDIWAFRRQPTKMSGLFLALTIVLIITLVIGLMLGFRMKKYGNPFIK